MDECENLPKNMCDSCIIQLNVAYNLKKNAIQSDMKLRQYMIEFGMNVTSYTACSINTVSVIRPPALLMPTSTTSESVTITTAKSTTVGPTPQVQLQPPPLQQPPSQLHVHRPFPVMPVIIKEEPVDYEVMSDITVETNTEAFEEHMRTHRNRTNGIHSTTSTSTSSSSNKSSTPLPVHSMVSVNSKSLLISTQNATDSEYISAYMTTPSSNSTKSAVSKSVNKRKSPESISLAVPKSKTKVLTKTTIPNTIRTNTNKIAAKQVAVKSRELIRLMEDNTTHDRNISYTSGRQTRQKLKDSPQLNGESIMANSPQRSRSGNNPKMDYKSFFSTRVSSPQNRSVKFNRRKSMDVSMARRKTKSPSVKIHQNKTKSIPEAVNRKRRSSISHNRTRTRM